MIAALKKRVPNQAGRGCFLCKWILEDLEKNGKFTDHPKDEMGNFSFPAEAKRNHLRLEAIPLDPGL